MRPGEWRELHWGLKVLLIAFAVMEAILFFGGIVMVMTARDWGQTINGYFAFLFSIGLAFAIAPAFRRY